nr:putative membrane protein YuiD [Tanacetum cinerariifolium]
MWHATPGSHVGPSLAKGEVRISPFVATLAANPTFVSGFFAWLMAQSLKVFLHFCFEKKLDLRVMCASGGMPSSHTALCTGLTTSVAICHGVADSLFPVCLGFTLIVMYDAIGVRRHAGMQAEVIPSVKESSRNCLDTLHHRLLLGLCSGFWWLVFVVKVASVRSEFLNLLFARLLLEQPCWYLDIGLIFGGLLNCVFIKKKVYM